jgi:hypothetical protein
MNLFYNRQGNLKLNAKISKSDCLPRMLLPFVNVTMYPSTTTIIIKRMLLPLVKMAYGLPFKLREINKKLFSIIPKRLKRTPYFISMQEEICI